MAMSKDLKTKLAIYTGNIVARPIGKLVNPVLNWGNLSGAIMYGVLDIFRTNSLAVRENPYVRLLQAGGVAFYGISAISDVFSVANGNYFYLIDLSFNASMAYQVGKNAFADYNHFNENPLDDFKSVSEDVSKLSALIKKK